MMISLVTFFTSVSLVGVINTSIEAYDPMSLAGTANTTMYTAFYGGVGMLGGIAIIALAIFILFVAFTFAAKGSM